VSKLRSFIENSVGKKKETQKNSCSSEQCNVMNQAAVNQTGSASYDFTFSLHLFTRCTHTLYDLIAYDDNRIHSSIII